MNDIKVFSFTADGNDVTLQFGWVPDYLRLVNATALATAGSKGILEWFGSVMGDGKQIEHIVLADNGSTGNKDLVNTASGGHLAQVQTPTIQTANPVKVLGGVGVKITASGFMADNDVIYGVAIRADRAIALGDTGDAAVGNTLTL